MFNLIQISDAHSKVRSGADFPQYIQDLKEIGVVYYETYVSDGHTKYFDTNNNKIASPAKYEPIDVLDSPDVLKFKTDLCAHQCGHSDYPTFCHDAANSGIEKWAVNLQSRTCTYLDKAGHSIVVEQIPVPCSVV